jgi:hypothetical protein
MDYRLVLDTSTFHGLTPEERVAMGRVVSAVASDDATAAARLLYAGPARAAAPWCTRADVEGASPGVGDRTTSR